MGWLDARVVALLAKLATLRWLAWRAGVTCDSGKPIEPRIDIT